MTLGATLYVKNSSEAVDIYTDALKLELGYNVKNEDGTYLHGELMKRGSTLFAVSESDDETIRHALITAKQPAVSLGINLDDDDELDYAFEKLSRDGHVLRPPGSLPWSPYSTDIVDRFGVCWYLYVTQHKPE